MNRSLERWLGHGRAMLTTGSIHLCLQLSVLLRGGAHCSGRWPLPCEGASLRAVLPLYSALQPLWIEQFCPTVPFLSGAAVLEPANHGQNPLKPWAEYTSPLNSGCRVFCPGKDRQPNTLKKCATTDIDIQMYLQASAFYLLSRSGIFGSYSNHV